MPLQSANIVVTREGIGNDTSVEDYAYEQSEMMQGKSMAMKFLMSVRQRSSQAAACSLI